MLKTITNSSSRFLVGILLAFFCLLISGCGGCRSDTDEQDDRTAEQKKKEKEKKKPDFETRTPVLLPGRYPQEPKKRTEEERDQDPLGLASSSLALRYNRAKLGHWAEASFQAIANNYNADGQLKCHSIDATSLPVPVPSTDTYVVTTRPAAMPKGEWKNLETSVFLPRRNVKTMMANVSYSFDQRSGGLSQIMTSQPTKLLKPFQYHLVLLSERPDSWTFLNMADSVRLHGQRVGGVDMAPPFYFIVPTNPGDPIPLPRNALNWTTIAYLVWDDLDPDRLDTDQQAAMLDWLHFGGQLILSGPDCLDRLQSSFVAEYLPAHADGSRNITNANLKDLNQNWTVPVRKNKSEKRLFQVSDRVPLLGVNFKPHVEASFIAGTGDLAIERQVGRGRVVVTAFSLNAPVVRKWRSFPSFLNSALLRRLPRQFRTDEFGDITFSWMTDETSIFDPLAGSTLRLLSRDLAATPSPDISYSFEDELKTATAKADYLSDGMAVQSERRFRRRPDSPGTRSSENAWYFGGHTDAPQSGVGGWNDDSGVAIAARQTLKEAAGIRPPSSGFVLKMLAAYLVVLVPVNWLVFRLLGRVEWAWFAAPVIAIVGAVSVVKMAALDIGFVRSNTQIGLLELHAGYSRGHATEYSALYTSLSTKYNVDLDNPSAQSLPFARVQESEFQRSAESLSQVTVNRSVRNRLEGFQIQSNSTGLLHTEFVLDIGGYVNCRFLDDGLPESISNRSWLDLQQAGVLYRSPEGEFKLAWVGELPGGSENNILKFEDIPESKMTQRWQDSDVFVSSERRASQLWDQYIGPEITFVDIAELHHIPVVAENWEAYQSRLLSMGAIGTDAELIDEQNVSKDDFLTVYQALSPVSGIQLGRLLDTIANHLLLAPGECRLFAAADQRLGRTRFDPEATQTDRQTLVVVHLKRPPLPPARRDENALTDFTGKSTLDWELDLEADAQEALGIGESE